MMEVDVVSDPATSPTAWVLRVKYYPNGGLLSAEPNDGISYTWGSISHGIELLKHGVTKQVGDGSSIDILADPWLPKKWSR